ncbi:hypothetical protein KHM25_18550 [Leptospira borgpetersenii]|nr:hypothetical protein KHM25_18550 [Leptospira borgpetersenii]
MLPERYKKEAERMSKNLDSTEQSLKLIEEETKKALNKNKEYILHAWDRYDYFFGDYELHG